MSRHASRFIVLLVPLHGSHPFLAASPHPAAPPVSTGMTRRTLVTSAALGCALVLASVAPADVSSPAGGAGQTAQQQNWPRWRGPEGNGHSSDADAPVKWDSSSVVWKAP